MSMPALTVCVCSILLAAAAAAPVVVERTASIAKISAANPAAPERCVANLVEVKVASLDERTMACSAARKALEMLGRCGMSPRQPLQVRIGNELEPLPGSVLGFFEAARETLFVARYDDLPSLVQGTPFAALHQRELFESIVVHEIAHGVLHQNSGSHRLSQEASEYVAYAVQIDSMSPEGREKFLRSIAAAVTTADFLFSDVLLSLDPFLFAAQAYKHFKASGDECSQLTALLKGKSAFISSPLY